MSERAHSYLSAEAEIDAIDVMSLVRRIVEEHVGKRVHVASMAMRDMSRKGFAENERDTK